MANNAGNWQWVAGTGNNPRPGRVMNPLRQAARFDRDGDYVRRYVPELASLAAPYVHEPWRLPAAHRAQLALPGAADRDGLSGLASRRPLAGHARGGSLVQPGKGCPTAACRALPIVARVGRVIFMCGPAGSGKSTVARQYERQGMTRLSVDQEAWARGVTTMPLPAAVRGDIERTLRARLLDLVRAGSDVVLDLSFWSRGMRDEYRALLRPLGVVPETVYLATDRATVLRRVSARAARDGDDFRLSAELAARYFDHFEAPTAAEGPLTVIGGDGSGARAPARSCRGRRWCRARPALPRVLDEAAAEWPPGGRRQRPELV